MLNSLRQTIAKGGTTYTSEYLSKPHCNDGSQTAFSINICTIGIARLYTSQSHESGKLEHARTWSLVARAQIVDAAVSSHNIMLPTCSAKSASAGHLGDLPSKLVDGYRRLVFGLDENLYDRQGRVQHG